MGLGGHGRKGASPGLMGAGLREGTDQSGDGPAERGWPPAGQMPSHRCLVGQGDGAGLGGQDDDGAGPGSMRAGWGGGARREAEHGPAPGHGFHAPPVVHNYQHRSSSHGAGRVGRPLAPLGNVASLTNAATSGGGCFLPRLFT